MRSPISILSISNRLTVISLVAGSLLGGGLPTRLVLAQPATEDCPEGSPCQQRWAEAKRLYKAGEYTQALPLLSKIYFQDGQMRAGFPIAVTLMRLDRPAEAEKFCQRLLDAEIETSPKILEEIRKLQQRAHEAASLQQHPPEKSLLSDGPNPALQQAPEPMLGPLLQAPVVPTEGPLPLYKRWWLWTAVGAAVTTGAVATALLAFAFPPAWSNASKIRPFP